MVIQGMCLTFATREELVLTVLVFFWRLVLQLLVWYVGTCRNITRLQRILSWSSIEGWDALCQALLCKSLYFQMGICIDSVSRVYIVDRYSKCFGC